MRLRQKINVIKYIIELWAYKYLNIAKPLHFFTVLKNININYTMLEETSCRKKLSNISVVFIFL